MESLEISRFQDIVLQFLKENLIVTLSDMEVLYTSVTVQSQTKVRGRPQLEVTTIVTADVYDSTQEIDDEFDFRETTERPFDTNMTGLLFMLTAAEDESRINSVDGASSSSVLEGENRWIGILAICVAFFILLIAIVCMSLYCWRKREVRFGNFGKDIDTSESEEDVPIPASLQAHSWESDDRFDMNNGLGANNVTVDVHKCNSATCPQCTKAKTNRPEFMRLTPRSVRWASLWQMASPFSYRESTSPSRSPKKSALKSPPGRLGSKKVSFDA